MTGTPPGWYPDPQGTTRWFDGTAWTAQTMPSPGGGPPRPGRGLVYGLAALGVVLVIGIVTTVVVLLTHDHDTKDTHDTASHHTTPTDTPTGTTDPAITTITSIPGASYDAAGVSVPSVLVPKPLTGSALTDGDKPEVLYVGADYCPFCAPERWALVAALARFGTFSGLSLTTSGSDDVYPDTATLSFHGATYTSDYVSLHAYEIEDREMKRLDPVVGSDETVFHRTDAPPLTTTTGSIPFLDVGGRYGVAGASFSPQVLAGMTHQQIATAAANPHTPVGRSVLTTANYLTAAICHGTDQQPADVCSSAGVTAAAARLPGGGG